VTDMSESNNTDLWKLIVRIDERTQNILEKINSNTGAIGSVKAQCVTVSGKINDRLKTIEERQTGELSGKDKAQLYGSLALAIASILVAVISFYR